MKKSEKEKLRKELDENFEKAVEQLDETIKKLREFLYCRLMTELQLFYNFTALLTEEEDEEDVATHI